MGDDVVEAGFREVGQALEVGAPHVFDERGRGSRVVGVQIPEGAGMDGAEDDIEVILRKQAIEVAGGDEVGPVVGFETEQDAASGDFGGGGVDHLEVEGEVLEGHADGRLRVVREGNVVGAGDGVESGFERCPRVVRRFAGGVAAQSRMGMGVRREGHDGVMV